MSCVSLSRCVTCKPVIHTDLWNWLLLGGPGLLRVKIGTTGGGYPFAAKERAKH
jgi:hypothetical protein